MRQRTDGDVGGLQHAGVKFLLLVSALLLPVTGALAQAESDSAPPQQAAPLPQQATPELGEVKAIPRAVRPRIASKRSAEINAREAERRLEQAQLNRREGAEPLPSERVQVNGTTTVSYAYWKRQEQLRLAVEKAQRRWNQTHRAYAGQAQPTQASPFQLVRHER